MINLLVYGDYVCSTGFGTVTRNIVQNLYKTGDFQVDVVGINYDGDPYDHNEWPGNVYPALLAKMVQGPYGDVFGRQRVLDLLNTGKYDVFFMVQDTFVVLDFIKELKEVCDRVGTKIVYYYPIDATPKPEWITEVVSKVDYPITYTNYAKRETLQFDPELEDKLEVIYHGTNTADFYPKKEGRDGFRKDFLKGYADGKFLILNVNRNQPRKDVLRSLLILKELKERGNKVLLYLHMAGNDVGGDIDQYALQLGLEYGPDYIYPGDIGMGYPISALNTIYNAADCLLTTTLGEGWGLSITEAMATRLPVIAPDNTSLHEMLGDKRGILIPSGKTLNEWITFGHNDNNRLRPLMSVHMAAAKIEDLMRGKTPDVEGAYAWATAHTWEVQSKEFERIIRKAASEKPVTGRTIDGQVVKLNREQRRKLAKAKK